MAVLPQNARLPTLNGPRTPYRISVASSSDDLPQVARRVYSSGAALSPLPTWAARSIAVSPFQALTIKPFGFGESQKASYKDQDFEIRGTVLDSAGSPMQRRVIVTTRDGTRLGTVRSNPDGTFKIRAWNYDLNRTLVVAIPDDGDLRNAVVRWGVIGVNPA